MRGFVRPLVRRNAFFLRKKLLQIGQKIQQREPSGQRPSDERRPDGGQRTDGEQHMVINTNLFFYFRRWESKSPYRKRLMENMRMKIWTAKTSGLWHITSRRPSGSADVSSPLPDVEFGVVDCKRPLYVLLTDEARRRGKI